MLISLAIDSWHVGVATREAFHIGAERLASIYARGATAPDHETVALSTCNRTELYAWCGGFPATRREFAFTRLARQWMGTATGARQLLAVARCRDGDDAARHLLRVAAGIESQVLGDGQLLGQLREAYQRSVACGEPGSALRRLFETALHVGKRVRTETSLSSGRHSIGAEAASLAARRFGSLGPARVVVVGSGKTAARVARQVSKLGARDMIIMNRTEARAADLAAQVGGRVAPLENVHVEVAMADIAIFATGSPTPLLRADRLEVARRNCGTATCPLLVIDLSLPRNAEPAVSNVSGAVVVDLDALRPVLVADERERQHAVPAAEGIVEVELQRFRDWLAAASAREAIQPLRQALSALCQREFEHAAGDEHVARRAADRVVAKLLARPMTELRGAIVRGERVDDLTTALTRLFAPLATEAARATVSSGD
jgi:glutamyl-tRNA reductase